MDADGGNQARLTTTPVAQETWPAWSPDGTTHRVQRPTRPVPGHLVDGRRRSDQSRLTTTDRFDAFPEWSPDGTRIVFTSDRAAPDDIWVMAPTGRTWTA